MKQNPKEAFFRRIPKVDDLLKETAFQALGARYSRRRLVGAIREVLAGLREKIHHLETSHIRGEWFSPEAIQKEVERVLKRRAAFHFQRVINATGVVIHTNLGRSLLAPEAIEHIVTVSRGYTNLEYDLDEGHRGIRYSHVQRLLCEITGAEDALVVNNNAGAVLIALNSLAKSREVVVSRGEMIEIGGSFRIPEVMAWSGAILKEVGTTNKTHLFDYERAIGEQTGLLLKVHTSNFRVVGFVDQVPGGEIADLAHRHGLPAMEDLGSGNLIDFRLLNLPPEPTVQEALRQGMDCVTFSGDKLLGGPQAGIILGKKRFIKAIQGNPLNRALRIDKLTLAGLEATLKIYEDPAQALLRIPTLQMIAQPPEVLRRKANSLRRRLRRAGLPGFVFSVLSSHSQVGGGALPAVDMPTSCVAVVPQEMSETKLERRLRESTPPVIARMEEGRVLLDVRTLLDQDVADIVRIFTEIAHEV